MKKVKSLAAVFLALFILAAIPTQAFAAETHEGVATMHTHQWRLDHYDTTYIPIDDETHLKTVYPVYYCTVSGCTNSYLGNGASSTVSHTMSSYSYTGNNYHSYFRRVILFLRWDILFLIRQIYWMIYRIKG